MKKGIIIRFIVGSIFILLWLVSCPIIGHFFDSSQAMFWILSCLNGAVFLTIGNRLCGKAMQMYRIELALNIINKQILEQALEQTKEHDIFPEFNN